MTSYGEEALAHYQSLSSVSEFIVRDSGQREDFGNGSVRDTNEGKPRPDLISPRATMRAAVHMAKGAAKYGDRNWEKGQPTSRFLESLERHLLQHKLGDRVEDHLAAVRFNLDALMHFEGTEWDDLSTKESP